VEELKLCFIYKNDVFLSNYIKNENKQKDIICAYLMHEMNGFAIVF
jgi:hypothetical protein